MIPLDDQLVLDRVRCSDKYELIKKMVLALQVFDYNSADLDKIIDKVYEREMVMSTALGFGLAIPHAKTSLIKQSHLVVARLEKAVDFEAMDELPVDLVFLVLSPANDHKEHIRTISQVSRMLNAPGNMEKIRALKHLKDINDIID